MTLEFCPDGNSRSSGIIFPGTSSQNSAVPYRAPGLKVFHRWDRSIHTRIHAHQWTYSLVYVTDVYARGVNVNLTPLTSKRGALATDARGCSLWRSLLERPPPVWESRVRDPLGTRYEFGQCGPGRGCYIYILYICFSVFSCIIHSGLAFIPFSAGYLLWLHTIERTA